MMQMTGSCCALVRTLKAHVRMELAPVTTASIRGCTAKRKGGVSLRNTTESSAQASSRDFLSVAARKTNAMP